MRERPSYISLLRNRDLEVMEKEPPQESHELTSLLSIREV